MNYSNPLKAIFLFLSLFLITVSLQAQVSFVWGRQFGSDKDQYVLNHVVDSEGNIYVAGKTTGVIENKNSGLNDGFLVKYDSTGNMLWKRQFGTEGDEDIQWSAIDKSGSVYITGFTTGSLASGNKGKEDAFVVKYDRDGKLLWTKQFGTDSTDMAKGICTDNNGFIYVTGMTSGKLGSRGSGSGDAFLIKLDDRGRKVYIKQFGTPAPDMGYSVTSSNGGSIYVSGTTWGEMGAQSFGMIDCFVSKFAPNGELLKAYQAGTDGFDIPMDIKVDPASDIYLAGNTSGNFGASQIGEGDAFLLKMDNEGRIIWNNQFGTKLHDGARSVDIQPGDPSCIVTSGLISLPPGSAFIRMYGSDGRLKWERRFIATGNGLGTSGKDVSIDRQGNIIHVGLTGASIFSNISGENDIYVVRLKME